MPGASYNQGDIVLIPFPFTDLSNSKVRPALIVSNATVNKTSDLICAQITSQVYKDTFTFEIKDADVTTSLKGYSEVRCHKLFTADKAIIQKKISHLHASKQTTLLNKIKSLL